MCLWWHFQRGVKERKPTLNQGRTPYSVGSWTQSKEGKEKVTICPCLAPCFLTVDAVWSADPSPTTCLPGTKDGFHKFCTKVNLSFLNVLWFITTVRKVTNRRTILSHQPHFVISPGDLTSPNSYLFKVSCDPISSAWESLLVWTTHQGWAMNDQFYLTDSSNSSIGQEIHVPWLSGLEGWYQ